MDIEDYFSRIGYKGLRGKPDMETLTAILQLQIRAVPFENLSIHCGEAIELNLEAIYHKIVRKNRGGWCMELNQLLFWALTTIGYEVAMLAAKVYSVPEERYCEKASHLLLLVTVEGKAYIVDSGFGIAFYQMWQPIELVSGKDQPQSPGIFRLTEDNGTWHFGKVNRKSSSTRQMLSILGKRDYRKIYSFTLEPHTIEDFCYVNKYLQTAPESVFTQNSICCLRTLEGSSTLIGWTLITVTFDYKDDTDLMTSMTVKDEDIGKILREKFNIVLERKFVPCSSKAMTFSD
ncbi:arylamine N-acetyltransferase, pineal gland isozyme NAT-10-like [Ornithorhynchus anatinus]|uniref:arylamine N-acetyltransferase n=1 Tax=Ornithorhynchus anatinus TaxID=9258 RepID=F7GEM4_ORNAN|nr:arylamine N-acetyltransferase, pineal gland isozyme NAT-10-like [Ornithorhynchus anatinus]XP_007669835.1 arylamine N-acetyltransferase, pineal gland isozyme NAT-10-like [Ornithorhynchus anatinus]XP_028930234.1 arylamine N-acetyltransferase, pineal gland isozyme NAT-10-like [Ornithorhynchus anatinus]XP_028930235.1 arylamine N-acetyltransferase, pineal gland isozyme NAT-10-like [Ornithorhynchus anatinus]